MRIAIIGGTGKEGAGLALAWAQAGQDVIIGSRSLERAQETAGTINAAAGRPAASGALNRDAAAAGEIVVLTVPYAAHGKTLEEIREPVAGKIVVDVTVPIDPGRPRRLPEVMGGSATEESQALLGPEARVVAAFQHVSHTHLGTGEPMDSDVLVCGDDPAARQEVIRLAGLLGLRGIDAGPARNARVIEGFTVVLLSINKRYGIKWAGIRITGIP
jgi:NADPH-dependent F420 reductase